jgi:hypothetical protein
MCLTYGRRTQTFWGEGDFVCVCLCMCIFVKDLGSWTGLSRRKRDVCVCMCVAAGYLGSWQELLCSNMQQVGSTEAYFFFIIWPAALIIPAERVGSVVRWTRIVFLLVHFTCTLDLHRETILQTGLGNGLRIVHVAPQAALLCVYIHITYTDYVYNLLLCPCIKGGICCRSFRILWLLCWMLGSVVFAYWQPTILSSSSYR